MERKTQKATQKTIKNKKATLKILNVDSFKYYFLKICLLTKVPIYFKLKNIFSKAEAFQKAFADFQQNGIEQEQKLAQNFQEALNTAVSEVAQKQDYDLILNAQAAIYVAEHIKPDIDITAPAIEKMKGLGKTSKDADKNKK